MDLLLFFHEGVILGDTPQGKFVHKIDFVRVAHVFILL